MIEPVLEAISAGRRESVYLVHGDLVLAEPPAQRLAAALAEAAGCEVEVRRRPARLAPILGDLRTYSLFSSAKVVVALDTAVLADRAAAADLLDDAEAALPPGEGELSARGREGASRLFQALRLFGIDPAAGEAEQAIASLPRWALEGGRALRHKKTRGRGKADVEELTRGLALLLERAREAGVVGWAEGDLAELGEALERGFPSGHALVLVERSVAEGHPLVATLAARGAVVQAGEVASERGGGWQGLDELARELERETGVGIRRDALAELARRTLRKEREGSAGADSTARFAGEYRKLANAAAEIDRAMVEEAVADRGQEDVWEILDAVGAGRGGEALGRLSRLLGGAEDPVAERLSFFSLLASFCRQLAAIRGVMRVSRVPAGEGHYGRFKAQVAPLLQGDLPGGRKSPLSGVHPFRLHRAYLAACRLPEAEAASLPWAVLQTEVRLKGGSSEPDAALASLIGRLCAGRS